MVLVEKDLKGLNTIGVLDHDIPPMLKRIRRHLEDLRPAALAFLTPEDHLRLIRQQPGLTTAQFAELFRKQGMILDDAQAQKNLEHLERQGYVLRVGTPDQWHVAVVHLEPEAAEPSVTVSPTGPAMEVERETPLAQQSASLTDVLEDALHDWIEDQPKEDTLISVIESDIAQFCARLILHMTNIPDSSECVVNLTFEVVSLLHDLRQRVQP